MRNELTETLFRNLTKTLEGYWIPACNGTETPIKVKGFRLLYCWNPVTGKHAYLNLDTDIILSDEEHLAIFCS
jgi:hypothetical protein